MALPTVTASQPADIESLKRENEKLRAEKAAREFDDKEIARITSAGWSKEQAQQIITAQRVYDAHEADKLKAAPMVQVK